MLAFVLLTSGSILFVAGAAFAPYALGRVVLACALLMLAAGYDLLPGDGS